MLRALAESAGSRTLDIFPRQFHERITFLRCNTCNMHYHNSYNHDNTRLVKEKTDLSHILEITEII